MPYVKTEDLEPRHQQLRNIMVAGLSMVVRSAPCPCTDCGKVTLSSVALIAASVYLATNGHPKPEDPREFHEIASVVLDALDKYGADKEKKRQEAKEEDRKN